LMFPQLTSFYFILSFFRLTFCFGWISGRMRIVALLRPGPEPAYTWPTTCRNLPFVCRKTRVKSLAIEIFFNNSNKKQCNKKA